MPSHLVAVPADLDEALDAAAQRLSRPRDWIVEQALQSWISREERRHQMIEEGLKDIDEGRVIDHAELKTWAAGLKD